MRMEKVAQPDPVNRYNLDNISVSQIKIFGKRYEMIRINSTSSCSRPLLISENVRLIVSHCRWFLFFKFAVWVGQRYQVQIQGLVILGSLHPRGFK